MKYSNYIAQEGIELIHRNHTAQVAPAIGFQVSGEILRIAVQRMVNHTNRALTRI
jgi:hypothetical protein